MSHSDNTLLSQTKELFTTGPNGTHEIVDLSFQLYEADGNVSDYRLEADAKIKTGIHTSDIIGTLSVDVNHMLNDPLPVSLYVFERQLDLAYTYELSGVETLSYDALNYLNNIKREHIKDVALALYDYHLAKINA